MSHVDVGDHQERLLGGDAATGPVAELLEPRKVWLGKTTQVRRLLPHKERRMVGAWCFVDHYGPDDIREQQGMRVPPHPHTGLQTVSWLVDGEILHRDSLGSHAMVHPGELNLMTSGDGITHSEESLPDGPDRDPILHGLQLWVALPDPVRRTAPPAFAHYADLPVRQLGAVSATVIMGELAGAMSPATAYTPLIGAELRIDARRSGEVPLHPEWEHAVLAVDGPVRVEGVTLGRGEMLYLGTGRSQAAVAALDDAARMLVLGGEPFEEELVMWWNFIGRSHDEVVQAREDWMAGIADGGNDRFGVVTGFVGDPLPAPDLPHIRLQPRGRTR